MPNFQQHAAQDLGAVFFNAAAMEFVTTHKIGSKEFPPVEFDVVVDRDLYTERNIKDKVENINLSGLVFFVKKSDWLERLDFIPDVDDELTFDGKRHLVSSVMDNMEVLEITIETNEG